MEIKNGITEKIKNETKKLSDIVDQYNPKIDSPPVCKTITEWLQKGFNDHINKSALYFEGKKISYDKLNKLSNCIANYLLDRGIKKGDQVGISLDRSIEMVACMIGIFKSGAVFVPLDPNYPAERIATMKEDAKLNLLIAHKYFADRFDKENIILWDKVKDELKNFSNEDPLIPIDGEDVAYIVFTSGSTGRPKGIAMPHRALSNVIEWQLGRDYFKKEAKLLQYSSISVDVSFQGIITTLASGGSVYLLKDSEHRDPRILLQKIKEFNIERIFIPYVAFRSLIEVAVTINSIPYTLREVITAGEQLRVDSAVRAFFSEIADSIIDNQYGASETHVISSHVLRGDPLKWSDLPSIGTPMINSGIYILDENMQPVREGETGELYLSGRNIAHGYIGRDDLTKKSFIKNPFDIKNRPVLYKTGDLGAYNTDGSIDLLGRSDHQIKIRGYRVEPGEINNIGSKFRGVAQCFTHAIRNQAEKTQLITYFVCQKGFKVNADDLKDYLVQSLPDYMVPAFILEIEEIPFTPSGKIDLKSLPEPEDRIINSGEQKKIKYKSETEKQLAVIWSEILGFKSIPRSTSYFDLGGDSLSAVTLFLKIEKKFGKIFPLSTLAHAPTLNELSKVIEEKNGVVDTDSLRSLQVLKQGDKNKVPLFLIHGGAGNVLMFKDLAHALDSDQPVFAFQWSGWDGFRGDDDILTIAKSYKKELRKTRPSGPYRLGGHCIGGFIAIEVARLLRAEGAEVLDPIIVSDAPNSEAKSYKVDEPETSEETIKAFEEFRKEFEAKIPENGQRLNTTSKENDGDKKKLKTKSFQYTIKKVINKIPFYRFIRSPLKNGRQTLRPFVIWYKLKMSKPIPIQDRPHYSRISQRRAIKNYKQTIYAGDILYLRSGALYGRNMGAKGWWDDPYMGFGELCSGCFEAHIIGGKHNDIFKKPLAHKIIKKNIFAD